jgi:hypothetical protein
LKTGNVSPLRLQSGAEQRSKYSKKAEDAGLRLSAMSENKRAWALQPTIVDDLRF